MREQSIKRLSTKLIDRPVDVVVKDTPTAVTWPGTVALTKSFTGKYVRRASFPNETILFVEAEDGRRVAIDNDDVQAGKVRLYVRSEKERAQDSADMGNHALDAQAHTWPVPFTPILDYQHMRDWLNKTLTIENTRSEPLRIPKILSISTPTHKSSALARAWGVDDA